MEKLKFKEYLNNLNIDINEEEVDKLYQLTTLTLQKNEVMNLTAIKDSDEFLIKMIIDSLLPLSFLNLDGKKIIDIGTGAGFPGLPLSILNESGDFTLLDSTSKKIQHVKMMADHLNLNIKTISSRAEEFARNNREIFDIAFARAVAPLNILLEIIIPLLKVGGIFIALKGPTSQLEIKQSSNALKCLDAKINKIYTFNLPLDSGERNIIVIEKIGVSKKKYPRDYSFIKNKPL